MVTKTNHMHTQSNYLHIHRQVCADKSSTGDFNALSFDLLGSLVLRYHLSKAPRAYQGTFELIYFLVSPT